MRSTPTKRRGPLARFRVLDLTRVRSGPTCVRQLADWGADVIKIESPPGLELGEAFGGSRLGPDFQNLHRNKRSITLNLKDPEGLKIFRKLVKTADVVVENFRPDVKARLGIDYPALRKVNKRIVLGSISGFGQDGPYAKRPGFDQITQGMGGLMAITGIPGQGPVRAGIAVSDSSAGLYLALGILTALLEREETGEGQWVHVSLLSAMIAMLDFQAARYLMKGEVAEQAGNDHPTSIPTGVFPVADGYVNIAASGQTMWERLCKALGATELTAKPEYLTHELRSRNRGALHADIGEFTKKLASTELLERFEKAGVAAGPIYRMDEMFADPQVKHLEMAAPIDHPKLGKTAMVAQPFRLSKHPFRIRTAPPECGEHTDAVMKELGYTAAQIAQLREKIVI
ncbi:MAG: CoA transferase [Betaproteobacteria bacterium]|nr:MAG: CoA transferase [Betaproteobacteria bacterium]